MSSFSWNWNSQEEKMDSTKCVGNLNL